MMALIFSGILTGLHKKIYLSQDKIFQKFYPGINKFFCKKFYPGINKFFCAILLKYPKILMPP